MEIIGLNGAALVACGTSLPVVRRLNDGMICRFVVGAGSLQWLPGSEFERLLAEGRVSQFETPIPLPFGVTTVQPLVLFVNDTFLDAAGVELPSTQQGTPCKWTNIVGEVVRTSATCLPENIAKQWLNESAKRLLDKIDDQIAKTCGNPGSNQSVLLQWADLGLCAATEKPLRWRLYLRYGDAMEPERVRRTFDAFVQREFPNCSWDFYLKEMKDLQEVVCSQHRVPNTDPPPPVNPYHKLRYIALRHEPELTLL